MTALDTRNSDQLFLLFANLDDADLGTWRRETLDSVFSAFAELSAEPWSKMKLSRRRHAIKRLRRAIKVHGWVMTPEQVRSAFQIGVRWERQRRRRQALGEDGDWNTAAKEAARREDLECMRADFQALARGTVDLERDFKILEDYALSLLAFEGREALAVNVLHDALRLLPAHTRSNDDEGFHTYSSAASSILPYLFRTNNILAISYMHLMLDKGRLPLSSDLQKVLREQRSQPDPDEAYAHARSVLDAACGILSTPGRQKLDRLLQDRLESLAFEEAVKTAPFLAFLEWQGEDASAGVSSDLEGPRLALRLWEAVIPDRGSPSIPSHAAIKTLDTLIVNICSATRLGPELSAPSRSTPSAHMLAIELAVEHLPHSLLVERAHRLLNSSVHSITLLRNVYGRIKARAPPEARKPFQWHVNLLPTFTRLTLGSVQSEAALVVQLYHEWTATGMAYPQGLWKTLWKSLGVRGDLEELRRVIGDYESTGRGRVSARIVAFVVEASAATPDYIRTLRLVKFFRTRAADDRTSGFLRNASVGHTSVSLDTYHAVLRQLAVAAADRRSDVMQVFSWMIRDGWKPTVETFNTLLAAQVFRPVFHLQDVDNAGAAYNALVRFKCEPDHMTYSLLMHGFLRMAERRARLGLTKSQLGLDAALRSFHKAADANLLVRGHQVAKLMRELARRHQWDQAKAVAERWWAGVVEIEKRDAAVSHRQQVAKRTQGLRAEMYEVELASEEVLRSETKWSGR